MQSEAGTTPYHFNVVLWLHFREALFCKRGKVGLYHHECAPDGFTFHALCKSFDCLHPDFVLIGVEHKYLQV